MLILIRDCLTLIYAYTHTQLRWPADVLGFGRSVLFNDEFHSKLMSPCLFVPDLHCLQQEDGQASGLCIHWVWAWTRHALWVPMWRTEKKKILYIWSHIHEDWSLTCGVVLQSNPLSFILYRYFCNDTGVAKFSQHFRRLTTNLRRKCRFMESKPSECF